MGLITKTTATYGMGDALNQRAFLVTYCKQKNISTSSITIFTDKYWWMFEDLGFKKGIYRNNFRGLTAFNNFGRYDLPKTFKTDKNDLCIAKNAGIDFSFDIIVPLSKYTEPNITLPERFITFNTGYGEFSGDPNDIYFTCTKAWPVQYWEEFVKLINIPCIQIGSGPSCSIIKGTYMNLVNKLTIKESAEVMRKALFHVDIEGGLPILNQHLCKKSVVLFGPCAIENQGRSFNLNLRANTCTPCYEWGTHKYKLKVRKSELLCKAHCMTDLTPEYVVAKIKEANWL